MNKLENIFNMMKNMSQEEFDKRIIQKNLQDKNYDTVAYLDDYFEVGLNLENDLCQEYKYDEDLYSEYLAEAA